MPRQTTIDRPPASSNDGPYVVINEHGYEVAVVVDYEDYLGLMQVLADASVRSALPAYWRRAVDDCLAPRPLCQADAVGAPGRGDPIAVAAASGGGADHHRGQRRPVA